jgi:hypothetical protein
MSNDTDFTFSVYLDGSLQSQLRPGGSTVIKAVESGVHTLEAMVGNEVIAEKTVNLSEDIEWVVYVQRYNITVTNQTDMRLSIYLDDSYQLESPPFSSKMIYGVSEGSHTLEARVGGDIIANRNFYLDKDTEWILSY